MNIHIKRLRFLLPLAATLVLVCLGAVLLARLISIQKSYLITDGNRIISHRSCKGDPEEVLKEAGVILKDGDTFHMTETSSTSKITVRRLQQVTVVCLGTPTVVSTYGESVGELLARLSVRPKVGEILTCPEDIQTFDGMRIELVRRSRQTITQEERIPHSQVYYESTARPPGEERVLVEGIDGILLHRAEVQYENGIAFRQKKIDARLTQAPVDELIVRGTTRIVGDHRTLPEVLGSTITTAAGEVYTYTDVLTCTATAYSCEGYTGITATGTVARVGAIAVDPTIIPYGTKLYVVSNDGKYVYGYCVAEDCGGGIKGNKIDLYFDTVDECWQFGRRSCTVYILADD